MIYMAARQVIHDAFMNGVKGIDLDKLSLEFGIQFTARGPDGRIMSHCEQGVIQQALEVQKARDKVAWAWNMFAYTPPGTGGGFERSILLHWMADQHQKRTNINPYMEPEGRIMRLARIALHDIALQDRRESKVKRRHKDIALALGVSVEDYESTWQKHYKMLRGYVLTLPERSLPPISRIIYLVIQKRNAAQSDLVEAAGNLSRALKMPVETL